ncbi:putative Thioredoxin-like superfamily [Helianthus annuus]|nr:putative Thioredoxin-like superfamily [Helianthus annuus]
MWKLDDFESYPTLLVMFICNHCPFVKHLKKNIVKLTNLYMKKGLGVVAIPSNSIVTHPQVQMDQFSWKKIFICTYAYGAGYGSLPPQDVERAYGAVCAPEFYLFKKVVF